MTTAPPNPNEGDGRYEDAPRPSRLRSLKVPWVVVGVTFLLIIVAFGVRTAAFSGQPLTGQSVAARATSAEPESGQATVVQVCSPACPCGPPSTPRADQTPAALVAARIGEPITVKPWAPGHNGAPVYTVRSVKQAPNSASGFGPGVDLWLVVDVEARGIGCAVVAGPHDFAFVAANGEDYPPIGTNAIGELESTPLEDGEHASGAVLFAVPHETLRGGRVVVRDFDGERFGYWPLVEPLAQTNEPESGGAAK